MHDALGDALMVEMHDLFAKDEVLQQYRAARTGFERILVIGNRYALIGRQQGAVARGGLVRFAARSG
jgi:hypothetical protein